MDPDSDGDGASDLEETNRGWGVYDAAESTVDSDGDGAPDAHEIAAGTDPDVPASVLSTDITVPTPSTVTVRVSGKGGSVGGHAAEVLEASATEFGGGSYTRTIPLFWDMTTGEKAQCYMDQWNEFEAEMSNVIRVTCRLICFRDEGDGWGAAIPKHQELPATYFIRSFSKVVAYTNSSPWTSDTTSELSYSSGPPWFMAYPTEDWIAQVDPSTDVGMGVYSPVEDAGWWYGASGNPPGGPDSGQTMHMAALATVKLERRHVLVYRYWMIYGNLTDIRARVYELKTRYPHG